MIIDQNSKFIPNFLILFIIYLRSNHLMSYEILLDDFLDELSKSGIDVNKIRIREQKYINEYTEFSKTKKEIYI